MSRKRQASDKAEVDSITPSPSSPNSDNHDSSNTVDPNIPTNRNQRSRTSSWSHNHHSLVRALSGLQSVPRSRQGSLKHQVLSSGSFVKRLEQQKPLGGHNGCVNTIAWDETGEFLLSGSDDLRLNIYRPLDPKPLVHSIPSGHTGNIFSAKYLTGSSASKIISCCANGITRLTDVNRYVERSGLGDWMPILKFDCHSTVSMTYEVMPDLLSGHIFYDCSDDGRINRYDIRVRTSCDCDGLENCDRHTFININANLRDPLVRPRNFFAFGRRRTEIGVSAITQRPEDPNYMAAACSDDTVRIYDCRNVRSSGDHRSAQVYSFSPFVPPGWVIGSDGELEEGVNRARSSIGTKITSLKYDPCRSGQLLASYSRGNCYLIDPSGMATGISMKSKSSKEESRRRLSQDNADIKGKRRRSPIITFDKPDDISESSLANKKSSSSTTKATNTNKDNHDDDISSMEEGGSVKRGKSVMEEQAEEEEEEEKEKGKGKGKEREKGKEEEEEEEAGFMTFRVRPRKAGNGKRAKAKDESQEGDSKVDIDDEDMDEDDDKRVGFVMDESDDDHEDSRAMDTDSDEESSLDSGIRQDEREYWTRRSFHSAKTDMMQVYSGHKNADTMASIPSSREKKRWGVYLSDQQIKEANFFGPNSEFIMSGSDDGRIFFWDKKSGKILNVIKGDDVVVNCLQPHPFSNFLLAASGIDHTIKIFMPTAEEPVNLSKIRGIKRPTKFPHELKPNIPAEVVSPTSPSGHPEDELDPELAYLDSRSGRASSESSSYSSVYGSDDSNDLDDDVIYGNPHLLQIIRQLVQGRNFIIPIVTRSGQAEGEDDDDDDDDDNDASDDE
ncbi:DDB1- and CUL4-associated factor 6 [Entomortierella chlamydospora]|uniref:DDB1- and CUL4-associated factor 6 n=1 Tax=Entomortierella chlamydospora TaxID=101097 RepID=A0A9P6MW06_9FUNG|nr:DDB1- and CUL4-associated factor 6 [Entomortierella chlamydospora]